MTNIEHPSEVRIGNTFTVVVEFDYGSMFSYCLYGDYIWLYYAVGLSPYIDLEGTQYIAKSINTPTPSTVS
ncbi:MAG: hypothetical protein KAU62_07920, partial [Candidatus Heimdallarchaeota archaeon]|nr:hypothetical protein [Candidatus Heimdallarchaeota archaeon]MCK4611067.1 hypothetical protein [Candidatus Heimdallarchaeota archaeon]